MKLETIFDENEKRVWCLGVKEIKYLYLICFTVFGNLSR